MRRWLAEQVSALPRTRTFSLKGSHALRAPVVEEHQSNFEIQVGSDIIRLARPHAGASADFLRFFSPPSQQSCDVAIPLAGVCNLDAAFVAPETFTAASLIDAPAISGNQLQRLTAVSVLGRNYRLAKSNTAAQRSLFGTEDTQACQSGLRKAHHESGIGPHKARKTVDLWELLFPLLKPPVRLESGATLDFPNELYPFQIEGVKRLVSKKSFLLADEMGTGKTVMTAVALRILFQTGHVRRALVLCPKSVLGVWDSHLRDWASTLSVTVVAGSRELRRIDWRCPAHIYITTYDTLRNDATAGEHERLCLLEVAAGEARFDAVVLDEAHLVKNPGAARTKAVRRLAKKARFRWALTGTPVQNTADDLRSIFDVVRPGLLPKRIAELPSKTIRRKIEPYFLRRRKQDVFPELPAKIRSDEWLGLDPAQRSEYELALRSGRDEFLSGRKEFSRMNALALLGRLKRICNFASGQSESPKSDALLEQMVSISASGKKALVFTQYKDDRGVKALEPLLAPFGVATITGDTPLHQREQLKQAFQTDPERQVFLMTCQTGALGLTLTSASYVIHFDHWWNPAVVWQAEDRAHRLGQTETVNVYSYWIRDTVEERVREILARKGLLHQEIVEALAEAEFDDALTIDDLLTAFDLTRESVRIPESERLTKAERRSVAEILQTLPSMDPYAFESLVQQVFREAMGYANARVTRRSADGGIDIEATRATPAGIERIVVQCKRKASVGPEVARELLGVLSANPVLSTAYLVTSGRLTKACRDFCNAQGRLKTIDGVQLAKLIHEAQIEITLT